MNPVCTLGADLVLCLVDFSWVKAANKNLIFVFIVCFPPVSTIHLKFGCLRVETHFAKTSKPATVWWYGCQASHEHSALPNPSRRHDQSHSPPDSGVESIWQSCHTSKENQELGKTGDITLNRQSFVNHEGNARFFCLSIKSCFSLCSRTVGLTCLFFGVHLQMSKAPVPRRRWECLAHKDHDKLPSTPGIVRTIFEA